jgi:hypothetical protein
LALIKMPSCLSAIAIYTSEVVSKATFIHHMHIDSSKSSIASRFHCAVRASLRLQEESSRTEDSSDLAGANGNSGVLSLLRKAGISSGRSVAAGGDGSSAGDGLGRGSGGFGNASRAVPVVTVGLASAGGGLVVVIVLIIVAVGCGGGDHGGSRCDDSDGGGGNGRGRARSSLLRGFLSRVGSKLLWSRGTSGLWDAVGAVP